MQKQPRFRLFALLLVLILGLAALYWRGDKWLRDLLLYLSGSRSAREVVTALPVAQTVAARFVAGETIADALRVAGELNQRGFYVAIDFLGESVSTAAEANEAAAEIRRLLDAVRDHDLKAYVSVKPSQLGLAMDQALGESNIRALVEHAARNGLRIRLDMEDSPLIDPTFSAYYRLRDAGFDNCGVVIQSYLFRSAADMERLVQRGADIRLVKGAYAEPPEIAYKSKADTDANLVRLIHMALSDTARQNGVRIAVASHDEKMVAATIAFADANHVPPDAYEFQMLYGVRRELQERLLADGYQVRVYMPYGTAWYPYFTRRLAERPANLWFFISNFFRR